MLFYSNPQTYREWTATDSSNSAMVILTVVRLKFFPHKIWLSKDSEKAMAPYSNTLAWKIPWTEEPSRLQSTGSLRVEQDWATSLSPSCIGEGNGNPLQYSCLENPRDRGAWWAAVYGVAQSRTRLKGLSSSSLKICHMVFTSNQTVPASLVKNVQ